MALPDDEAIRLAAETAAEIDHLAAEALQATLIAISAGRAARDAVAEALTAFSGQFEQALAQRFGELLQRAIGVNEIRAMPVGAVPLSSRLYLHAQQTSNEVAAVVREHAQGVHQARVLALQLYDGYDPKGAADRPLEGRARAELPKALQALTQDAETRKSLEALIRRGQAQAARVKSPALRAGYTEAFDAWAAGKGEDVLKRKMEVALREKTRYMANRIAQTELARAHQAQVGAELMADDGVEVVQWLMNPAHPLIDVCDFHAKANLFGLGAGCYPKARAPVPPAHPHCWCRLRARRSLSGLVAREVEGGPAAWLRGLPVADAARVMGSRERLQRVLDGEPVDGVLNGGKDLAYRLRRLGDGIKHALVRENAGMRTFKQPSETFGPYDRAAPRVAPDVSTPARAAAVRVEDQIRHDALETGVFIDPDGAVLLRRQGEANRVTYQERERLRMRGATFTHNHPGEASFSMADYDAAVFAGVRELRAVSPSFRHSLLLGAAMPTAQDLRRFAASHDAALSERVQAMVKSDIVRAPFAGVELQHQFWIEAAQVFGFSYTRDRS